MDNNPDEIPSIDVSFNNILNKEITVMHSVLNTMQRALAEANPNYKPTYLDVETVAVFSNANTPTSKNMVQLAMEQYGLDTARNREQVSANISGLMAEKDI